MSDTEINLNDAENIDNQAQNMSGLEKGSVVVFSLPILIRSIVVFLISAFIFFISIFFHFHSLYYVQTTATVVDSIYDEDENTYIPIYEYEYNGEPVRVEGIILNADNKIIIGEKVEIQYDPNDYEHFDIGSKKYPLPVFAAEVISFITSIIEVITIIKMYKAFIRGKKQDCIE